jgi:hypothetical protein
VKKTRALACRFDSCRLDGKSYTFAYDTVYGLVNKITYPAGGYARYVWDQNPLSHYGQFTPQGSVNTCQMHYAVSAIKERFVSDGQHRGVAPDLFLFHDLVVLGSVNLDKQDHNG